uniref:Large ribosomal subunit protein mL49 n=1 Tax=Oncorhynchus mykiss TaxID=8022 RepID=A0A8K9X7E7_ONCMY
MSYQEHARILFSLSLSLQKQTLCIPAGEAKSGILASTEEYKFVEQLISPSRVPFPPKHDGPSPFGWNPPSASASNTLLHLNSQDKVEGNIWASEKDVKEYLQQLTGKHLPTQVNEVTMTFRVKGHFDTALKEWLVKKGF